MVRSFKAHAEARGRGVVVCRLIVTFFLCVMPLYSQRALRQVFPAEMPLLGGHAGLSGLKSLSPAFANDLGNPLVQKYFAEYASEGGKKLLSETMERAAPYLAFIRSRISEKGLPKEILYLPVVESSYTVSAVSKSGAAGLWQFMANSVAPFNLQINDTLDERFDFWKSTEAAIAKLQDNYNALGNWELALAAYNIGLGAMQRIIKETGTKNYWELVALGKIKPETAQYVPKLIAAAYILENPRYFQLDINWLPDPNWQRIGIVQTQISLEALAQLAGMDYATLLAANRECLNGITPAQEMHSIKVPAQYTDTVMQILTNHSIMAVIMPIL
ncbi:MAG: lytic transglycosylase domain-containing protein [Spirochaetaceae bacterium]|jgi:membrane-bound lytic murein transglycosylase D|nr:lytic transglycosylase domain-containing protein [Spirochaetaceae bacterium]